MKQVFRNFVYVLKRFKTPSILNILGLSAAFAVFIVLTIQVYYDFSFDRNFKNADEIYMMSLYSPFNDQYSYMVNTQMGDEISAKTPLVDAYTSTSDWSLKFHEKDAAPETAINESYTKVRGDFIDVFAPKVLEGDLKLAIAEGNNLAISQKAAKKMFGAESAIGKTVIDYYEKQPYIIRAVLEDFPENCSLKNGVFGYLPENPQSQWSFSLYMKIKPENHKKFEEFINSEEYLGKEMFQMMENDPTTNRISSAILLTDIHLQYPAKGSGDLSITLSLAAIAFLTLIIAYINFINFSIAMAPARVKPLNIQRVLGMGKKAQQFVIASESAIFSLIAFVIALIFVSLIKGSPLAELFSVNLALKENINLLIVCGFGAVLLGIVFGLYPAKYITDFNVLEALKGTSSGSVKSSKLRAGLITFQFVAAITLIIITSFIKIQHDYMINYSWGIQKNNIVFMDMRNKGISYKTFTDELLKDPRIKDYTLSQFVPGNVQMGWGRYWEGKQISVRSWPVADNYLQFFGATVIAGEDFPVLNNPDKVKMIFNEKFVEKYEFKTEDILGKVFPAFTDSALIIGVVKDINFETLKMPIQPMGFITLGDSRNAVLFLKLSGNDIKGAVKLIENTWPKYSKESLDLQFLDENLTKLYRNENNLAKLISVFSLITILIAIMGVYGLITFNTRYRMKEIAIRKVNGADESSILLIINKGMLYQLLVGFIVAVPIAYFIVNKWLDSFAYRTPIYWWVFPLAGLIMLVITVVSVSWQSYRSATANPIKFLKSE